MTTPQIIMVILLTLGTATNLLKAGEYYTKNALSTILVSAPLITTVLWCGGYWEVVNAPQIITIILMTLNCVFALVNHGKRTKYTGAIALADLAVIVALYWWGGFWG